VHEDGVAVADESEQCLELWSLRVFARDAVGKGPVEVDAVELTAQVLVQPAHPGV